MNKELIRSNLRLASSIWGKLPEGTRCMLEELTQKHRLSVAGGDLHYIDGHWYVSHAGLLRIARQNRCAGIRVQLVDRFCESAADRWAFEATVYKSRTCRGFVGYGDADPSNVSPRVRGAEMRVAETRAVNRALRKAYGIGICSVEELGSLSRPAESASSTKKLPPRSASDNGNGNGNGQPRLRDILCLLIRQHHLDAGLVKRYATEFCAVSDLRQAGREQVEALIKHLGEFATKDPDGLAAKLNSYAAKQEGAGAA